MKKAIKRVITLVLILSMVTQVFAYSFDEIMKDRVAITDSKVYDRKLMTGSKTGKLEVSNKTGFSVLDSANKNLLKGSENIIWDMPFTIEFGSYPQKSKSSNSKDPIEWVILYKKDGMALLMSYRMLDYKVFVDEKAKSKSIVEDALKKSELIEKNKTKKMDELYKKWMDYEKKGDDVGRKALNANGTEREKLWNEQKELLKKAEQYHREYMEERSKLMDRLGISFSLDDDDEIDKYGLDYDWVKSDLRKWLNKEFYKNAFSSKEKKAISPLTIEDEKDNVFILSSSEIEAYFQTRYTYTVKWNNGKISGVPWYASDWTGRSKDLYDSDSDKNKYAYYWTRNARPYAAMNTSVNYEKVSSNINENMKYGVRPCIWVKYDENAYSANRKRWDKFFMTALEIGLEVAKDKYLS